LFCPRVVGELRFFFFFVLIMASYRWRCNLTLNMDKNITVEKESYLAENKLVFFMQQKYKLTRRQIICCAQHGRVITPSLIVLQFHRDYVWCIKQWPAVLTLQTKPHCFKRILLQPVVVGSIGISLIPVPRLFVLSKNVYWSKV
jgi:hypothetical protein